jgi:polyisoprenoid-binding protein YceI
MKKYLKTIAVSLIIFSFSLLSHGQNIIWNLDKSHSTIGFSIDHLMISETTGKFDDYSVNVKSDKSDFTDAVFSFEAKVKSINTNDAKRDEHLSSADFFNSEKYPNISFVGKKFTKLKGNQYNVTGELTMHGITKAITLNAKFGGIVKDPWGGTRAGISITGELDRYEFDLKYNNVLEAGGLAIGQKVKLNISVELIKK